MRMDVERHVVAVDGEPVALPLKEFDLLELLLRNAGRVLTRGQLIDRVWGADYVGDTKTLDVHVKRLRAKLEPDPANPRYLVTVRGLGYKFEAVTLAILRIAPRPGAGSLGAEPFPVSPGVDPAGPPPGATGLRRPYRDLTDQSSPLGGPCGPARCGSLTSAGLFLELVDLDRGVGLGDVVGHLLAGLPGQGVQVALLRAGGGLVAGHPVARGPSRRWGRRPGRCSRWLRSCVRIYAGTPTRAARAAAASAADWAAARSAIRVRACSQRRPVR